MDNEITLDQLIQDVDDEIAASSAQGFWTPAMKKDWINRAGQKVCGFYRWPFLELAVYTSTRDQKEYYTYPREALRFKPNSIYQITIEGEDYPQGQQGRLRVNWQRFVKAKQDGSDEKIFSNHNGFFFLHPIPEDGKEMVLFGLKGWQTLVNGTDTPVTPTEFDESIIKLAKASALRKSKKYKEAQAEMIEVLDPQVGTLAILKADIENEGANGYGGEAQSSRWGANG